MEQGLTPPKQPRGVLVPCLHQSFGAGMRRSRGQHAGSDEAKTCICSLHAAESSVRSELAGKNFGTIKDGIHLRNSDFDGAPAHVGRRLVISLPLAAAGIAAIASGAAAAGDPSVLPGVPPTVTPEPSIIPGTVVSNVATTSVDGPLLPPIRMISYEPAVLPPAAPEDLLPWPLPIAIECIGDSFASAELVAS